MKNDASSTLCNSFHDSRSTKFEPDNCFRDLEIEIDSLCCDDKNIFFFYQLTKKNYLVKDVNQKKNVK